MKYSPSKKRFFNPRVQSALPDDCIEISMQKYKSLMYQQSKGMLVTFNGETLEAVERSLEPTVDELSSAAQLEFQSEIKNITGGATPEEIASWETQKLEAFAWTSDNYATTPYIDALLAARNLGETKQELVSKIIGKSNAYAQLHAQALGKYQSNINKINK